MSCKIQKGAPRRHYTLKRIISGAVAQLGERRVRISEAVGSIPISSTVI